jgi:hypothetical protein
LEDLGNLFKGDPLFNYFFRELPRGAFLKIIEYRRYRQAKSSGIDMLNELQQ